jgi:hypothetical protein
MNNTEHPKRAEISALAQQIFHLNNREILGAVGTPQYEQFVLNAIDQGTQPVQMLAGGAPARQGLEAMLSSCMTGTWTAFETMAGDLWETALNMHPKGLAELQGKRKRLLKGAEIDSDAAANSEQDDSDGANLKSVPLNEILRHEFKIEHRMGSVLRTRQRFDHLAGIREAYSLAFSRKADDIDVMLKQDSLDAVNAVRNLIVHRSGVVDQTYERKAKFLKIPTSPIGFPIFLDGEIVRKLMTATVICSLRLIVAVDEWIATN